MYPILILVASVFVILPGVLLTATATASQAWVLQTNHNEVEHDVTRDVTLTCKREKREDASADSGRGDSQQKAKMQMQMQTLQRIRIIKADELGDKQTFAVVHFNTKTTSGPTGPYVNVTSSLETGGDEPFLRVTWRRMTGSTIGGYGCEISGYDSANDFVTMKAPPVKIREKALRIEDVRELIESKTVDFECSKKMKDIELENGIKFKDLETKNTNLKSFISEQLQILEIEIRNDLKQLRSDMEQRLRDLEKAYVTKNILDSEIDTLRNSTLSKMNDDRYSNGIKHDQIYAAIRETEDNFQANQSFLEATAKAWRVELDNRMHVLSEELREYSNHTNSRIDSVENQMSAITADWQNMKACLSREMKLTACSDSDMTTKKMSAKPQITSRPTTFTTTTTTPSPSTSPSPSPIAWPDGSYALITHFMQECPDTHLTGNGRRQSVQSFQSLPSNIYNTWGDKRMNGISGISMLRYDVHSRSHTEGVKFCLKKKASVSNNGRVWPSGSFCINEYQADCPSQFSAGFLYFSDPKEQSNFIMIQFCCMNNGRPDTPIQLPNKKPFFLYRYGGRCQAVEGMKVNSVEKYLAVREPFRQDPASGTSGIHPDMGPKRTGVSGLSALIHLCEYIPNTA